MHAEIVLNSSYIYDEIETSKEVLAGLKMMLTFLSRAKNPPVLLFFGEKSHCHIPHTFV